MSTAHRGRAAISLAVASAGSFLSIAGHPAMLLLIPALPAARATPAELAIPR